MHMLGIDIAKATFDATLLPPTGEMQYQSFANTPAGYDDLQQWLTTHGVRQLHACMEATNVYWEALAELLYTQGFTVSVVNPARIKGYAQAELQRTKTDKLDSHTIAMFCRRHQPTAWQPPSAVKRQLRNLVRHRDDLLHTKLQQQNRLRDTKDSIIRQSLETVLTTVQTQIDTIDATIKAHIAAHAELRTNAALLKTIKGLGVVTIAKLLAELAPIDQYESAQEVAADVGVTPRHHQSGTSVKRRPHMCKIGKAHLRAALYLPAITAMTHNAELKAFAARLAARGTASKAIIGAVMRKLLHIVYGVLKHQTPYDPTKVLGPTAAKT